jgi:hypothetical protein
MICKKQNCFGKILFELLVKEGLKIRFFLHLLQMCFVFLVLKMHQQNKEPAVRNL